MQKISIENLQLTLSGSNLYYFTAVKGISPEIGTASTYNSSYSNYPPVRRLSVAAKVTFSSFKKNKKNENQHNKIPIISVAIGIVFLYRRFGRNTEKYHKL